MDKEEIINILEMSKLVLATSIFFGKENSVNEYNRGVVAIGRIEDLIKELKATV